jgi:hypothetical protein
VDGAFDDAKGLFADKFPHVDQMIEHLSKGKGLGGLTLAGVKSIFVSEAFILEDSPATCDPSSWTGYDGVTCGECAALVNVRDNGGSCSSFCELQGLSCSRAWDGTTDEECSLDAPQLGCDYVFESSGTSDGVCECLVPGVTGEPVVVRPTEGVVGAMPLEICDGEPGHHLDCILYQCTTYSFPDMPPQCAVKSHPGYDDAVVSVSFGLTLTSMKYTEETAFAVATGMAIFLAYFAFETWDGFPDTCDGEPCLDFGRHGGSLGIAQFGAKGKAPLTEEGEAVESNAPFNLREEDLRVYRSSDHVLRIGIDFHADTPELAAAAAAVLRTAPDQVALGDVLGSILPDLSDLPPYLAEWSTDLGTMLSSLGGLESPLMDLCVEIGGGCGTNLDVVGQHPELSRPLGYELAASPDPPEGMLRLLEEVDDLDGDVDDGARRLSADVPTPSRRPAALRAAAGTAVAAARAPHRRALHPIDAGSCVNLDESCVGRAERGHCYGRSSSEWMLKMCAAATAQAPDARIHPLPAVSPARRRTLIPHPAPRPSRCPLACGVCGGAALPEGGSCKFMCKDGYTVSESTTCEGGHKHEGTCDPNPCVFPSIKNGAFVASGDFPECGEEIVSGAVCSFKCDPGYTPRSVTDFPPVAERDGWVAKDGKDPGDVGLLKCERGSMYDAHELAAGGTKTADKENSLGNVVEEVWENVVVSSTPDAQSAGDLCVPETCPLPLSFTLDDVLIHDVDQQFEKFNSGFSIADLAKLNRDLYADIDGDTYPPVKRPMETFLAPGSCSPSHPSVVDEAGNQPMCHKEICSSWCGADLTTKFDAWTTDADGTPFLDWCVNRFVELDLELRVSQAEELINFLDADQASVLAGENPPPAEFDFPAAMLGVRAAVAR